MTNIANIKQQVFFDPANLTIDERKPALDRMEALSEAEIARLAASPPREWGVSAKEEVALATFMSERRSSVRAKFNGGTST